MKEMVFSFYAVIVMFGNVIVGLFEEIRKGTCYILSKFRIVRIAEKEYMLVINLGEKYGYLCLHPFPTSRSKAYAFLSPNHNLLTATWYIGPDKKERIVSMLLKAKFGHGFRCTQIELAQILIIRKDFDDLWRSQRLLLETTISQKEPAA